MTAADKALFFASGRGYAACGHPLPRTPSPGRAMQMGPPDPPPSDRPGRTRRSRAPPTTWCRGDARGLHRLPATSPRGGNLVRVLEDFGHGNLATLGHRRSSPRRRSSASSGAARRMASYQFTAELALVASRLKAVPPKQTSASTPAPPPPGSWSSERWLDEARPIGDVLDFQPGRGAAGGPRRPLRRHRLNYVGPREPRTLATASRRTAGDDGEQAYVGAEGDRQARVRCLAAARRRARRPAPSRASRRRRAGDQYISVGRGGGDSRSSRAPMAEAAAEASAACTGRAPAWREMPSSSRAWAPGRRALRQLLRDFGAPVAALEAVARRRCRAARRISASGIGLQLDLLSGRSVGILGIGLARDRDLFAGGHRRRAGDQGGDRR